MVDHTAALRRTARDPPRSLTILGLQDSPSCWDSLMFTTTDARIRSRWVTFETSSVSCSGQPHRQDVPLLWNKASSPDEYPDFTKEYGLRHERLTLPTTFNTK